MRVLIAPDSFGGTLTSGQAASAIAQGWRFERSSDEIAVVPLADGGEGTLDALAQPDDSMHVTTIRDAIGRSRKAQWLSRQGTLAIIESAEACGLRYVDPWVRDVVRSNTYGVGQLLEAAIASGCRRIAVGLGGSATVDGGIGALRALGVKALDDNGMEVEPFPYELRRVRSLDASHLARLWIDAEVNLWVDVTTTIGEAATLFGPQKGADQPTVEELDSGLRNWVQIVERDLDVQIQDLSGSGAAGGLAFGLAAIGATMIPGAAAVQEMLGLDGFLRRTDVVVTGEGRLDATSLKGKVIGTLLRTAQDREVPCLAVVGQCQYPVSPLLVDVEAASPEGPRSEPFEDVRTAATRLAARFDRDQIRD